MTNCENNQRGKWLFKWETDLQYICLVIWHPCHTCSDSAVFGQYVINR